MEVVLIMTYKQIEASREIRLWTTQVIVPALGMVAAMVTMVPEFREAVVAKAKEVKDRFKYKIRK
jgi:hypothetical protein